MGTKKVGRKSHDKEETRDKVYNVDGLTLHENTSPAIADFISGNGHEKKKVQRQDASQIEPVNSKGGIDLNNEGEENDKRKKKRKTKKGKDRKEGKEVRDKNETSLNGGWANEDGGDLSHLDTRKLMSMPKNDQIDLTRNFESKAKEDRKRDYEEMNKASTVMNVPEDSRRGMHVERQKGPVKEDIGGAKGEGEGEQKKKKKRKKYGVCDEVPLVKAVPEKEDGNGRKDVHDNITENLRCPGISRNKKDQKHNDASAMTEAPGNKRSVVGSVGEGKLEVDLTNLEGENKEKRKTKKRKREIDCEGIMAVNSRSSGRGGANEGKVMDENGLGEIERPRKERKKKNERAASPKITDEKLDDAGTVNGNQGSNKHSSKIKAGRSKIKEKVNGEGKNKVKKKTKLLKKGSESAIRTKTDGDTSTLLQKSMTQGTSNKRVIISDDMVLPSNDQSDEHTDKEKELVRGKRFSKEENEMLRKAVLDYIDTHELGKEGLKMVLHCKKYPEVRNCWKEIGAALPWRPHESIYYRAHILFQRDERRTWTSEEMELVRKFHEKHGSNWKKLAGELGKHRLHVKDTWRRIKLANQKKGHWSQEEYQKLFDLVNMDLRMKIYQEKKTKHGMLRDNISWGTISDKLGTRSDALCCMKWYNQLTSPMVGDGKWLDTDDFKLLIELYNLDACCIEDVDWDNLVEHRSGDLCRKRWDQMVKHLGEHGNKSFSDQLEVLMDRYCPDVLEAREVYNSKPAVS